MINNNKSFNTTNNYHFYNYYAPIPVAVNSTEIRSVSGETYPGTCYGVLPAIGTLASMYRDWMPTSLFQVPYKLVFCNTTCAIAGRGLLYNVLGVEYRLTKTSEKELLHYRDPLVQNALEDNLTCQRLYDGWVRYYELRFQGLVIPDNHCIVKAYPELRGQPFPDLAVYNRLCQELPKGRNNFSDFCMMIEAWVVAKNLGLDQNGRAVLVSDNHFLRQNARLMSPGVKKLLLEQFGIAHTIPVIKLRDLPLFLDPRC